MTEPIPSIEPDVPGRDGRGGLLVRAPYREGLVRAFKASLPARQRYWDAGIGAWWIDAREADLVAEIVLEHFPMVFVLGGPGEEGRVLRRPEGSAPNLYLRPDTREIP